MTRKRKLVLMAVAMALLSLPLSGYEVACTSGDALLGDPAPVAEPCPPGEACASDVLRKKPYVHNNFYWSQWYPVVNEKAFDVYSHDDYVSWGVNLTKKSIRWIAKYAGGDEGGDCKVPLGSCESVYGFWQLETCDRVGGDTCLFRHENQGHASYSFQILWNSWMKSCLGTRISWNIYDGNGGHARNAWEGACIGGSPTAAASIAAVQPTLTLGQGDKAVSAYDYLTDSQINNVVQACFKGNSRSRCEMFAKAAYKALPPKIQRRARPTACAALSPRALSLLHPGTECERRANGGRS